MSLKIDEIVETLHRVAKLDPKLLVAVETDLEAKEAELKQEKADNQEPKQKNQFVTILLDPEHKLDGLGDFSSLLVQIPEDADTGDTLNRIYAATYDQRAMAKRKVKVINTVSEAADGVKRKFLKERNIHIKTKEPVRVLISDNVIPIA